MTDNLVACATAGRIKHVATAVGARVEAGDAILIVDAAGDQIVLDAPVAGRIKDLFFGADETLPEAAIVAVIET